MELCRLFYCAIDEIQIIGVREGSQIISSHLPLMLLPIISSLAASFFKHE
jgi:hypothetical protein